MNENPYKSPEAEGTPRIPTAPHKPPTLMQGIAAVLLFIVAVPFLLQISFAVYDLVNGRNPAVLLPALLKRLLVFVPLMAGVLYFLRDRPVKHDRGEGSGH